MEASFPLSQNRVRQSGKERNGWEVKGNGEKRSCSINLAVSIEETSLGGETEGQH
jgi:hypothetical protein